MALEVGASVFVPAPATRLYETLLDVRNFPAWTPAVRRVNVVEGPPGPGMVSEWEVSLLGIRKRILSVLEIAENSGLLRWSYEGPVDGWGACELYPREDGTLARFATELRVAEPVLGRLLQRLPVHSLATSQLKRSLLGLGRMVCGEEARGRILVGPLEA
ncbi:MAG: SRPBCC family protein [Rubrobacteraceae bacterium]